MANSLTPAQNRLLTELRTLFPDEQFAVSHYPSTQVTDRRGKAVSSRIDRRTLYRLIDTREIVPTGERDHIGVWYRVPPPPQEDK